MSRSFRTGGRELAILGVRQDLAPKKMNII